MPDARTAPRALIDRYVDAFNRGDTEMLRALFTPDAQIHGVLGSGGLDVALPIWRELHAAFAIALAIEDVAIDGARVVVRYVERGTFRAPFRGQAPTGRSYEMSAIEWFALRDGRIAARWAGRDGAAMARQIGLALG